MKVGLVIMASGLGKRFGGNKLMAQFMGKPLISWILNAAEDLFDQKIVVTRNSQVKELCEDMGLQCIYHTLPFRSDTVRLGVQALMHEVDYCFFVPGDQPLIKKGTLTKLIESAKKEPDRIFRTGYEDIVGSPVGFPKRFFEELMNLPEGKGGGWIVKQHPELVQIIPAQDAFELFDIDTTDDLALLTSKMEEGGLI